MALPMLGSKIKEIPLIQPSAAQDTHRDRNFFTSSPCRLTHLPATAGILPLHRLLSDILAIEVSSNMTMAMPQGNAVFPRSHVGFDSITQQIEKKLLKRGFQFNVICVG
jgi:hypothetical protein